MDPLLIEVPDRLETARLILRPPRAGDGPAVNEAVRETMGELQPWMPWATPVPTVEQSESWCRKGAADFLARRQLPLLMFRRDDAMYLGGTGTARLHWDVPWFEVGYWVRRSCAGRGYVTEAARAVTEWAFGPLKAERVEIRCDDRNERSWRVAERCGFALEGVLRRDSRGTDGSVRDTRVYARVRPENG
jgi:RimJ/RimL family protein N-acetyltransferase